MRPTAGSCGCTTLTRRLRGRIPFLVISSIDIGDGGAGAARGRAFARGHHGSPGARRPRRRTAVAARVASKSIAGRRRRVGIEAAALAIGGLWPTGSRASTKVRVGTLEELIAANPGLPIDEGFPAYVPAARAFVMLLDPGRRIFLQGRRRDRRRQRAQCPRTVADLSAPGLPPEPVHRGLLAALPLSPVALRPARDQDRGRAVRAGAAQHGPLSHRGRRARRADDRHAQGDPWTGAEGAW